MFSTPCSCFVSPVASMICLSESLFTNSRLVFDVSICHINFKSKLHQKDYGHILRVSLPCPPSAGIAKSLLNIVAFNLFFDFSCNKWLEGTTNTTLQPNVLKCSAINPCIIHGLQGMNCLQIALVFHSSTAPKRFIFLNGYWYAMIACKSVFFSWLVDAWSWYSPIAYTIFKIQNAFPQCFYEMVWFSFHSCWVILWMVKASLLTLYIPPSLATNLVYASYMA